MGVTYLITLVILVFRFLLPANAQAPLEEISRILPVSISSIVGGASTTTKSFPWQLYVDVVKQSGTAPCGGSTISLSWCMSAAHCFAESDFDESSGSEGFTVTAERIILYAGVTNRFDRNSDPKVQKSQFEKSKGDFKKHVFIHPQYGMGGKYNNDITIIKLKEPWMHTETVSPIALANLDDFIVDKKLTVSGWGRTNVNAPSPNDLQTVSGLNLISREECEKFWNPKGYKITDKMICHKTKDKNTCSGDSGGLVITGSGESNGPPYVQIGIVSWGSKDCAAYVPKVFVEVAKFKTWISETMDTACRKGFFNVPGSGNQCFKFFPDSAGSWDASQQVCRDEGLQLAKPDDPATAVALRKFMVETFGDKYAWLGARGVGSHMEWIRDGTTLFRSNSAWVSGFPNGHTLNYHCLVFLTYEGSMNLQPTQPYLTNLCGASRYPLCEVVM